MSIASEKSGGSTQRVRPNSHTLSVPTPASSLSSILKSPLLFSFFFFAASLSLLFCKKSRSCLPKKFGPLQLDPSENLSHKRKQIKEPNQKHFTYTAEEEKKKKLVEGIFSSCSAREGVREGTQSRGSIRHSAAGVKPRRGGVSSHGCRGCALCNISQQLDLTTSINLFCSSASWEGSLSENKPLRLRHGLRLNWFNSCISPSAAPRFLFPLRSSPPCHLLPPPTPFSSPLGPPVRRCAESGCLNGRNPERACLVTAGLRW